MSLVEAQNWMAYIRQTGPVSLGKRLEIGIAQLRQTMYRLMGKDAELKDFLPVREVTEEKGATAMDALALLSSLRRA
ncbi:phage tail assembly protein T [Pseudomonas typographi]|uniref:Minor tail T domain-containing protein n=1 Tax=Pseudomonas typographi TaxID=2715964 RepID=A0ABR7ZAA3_9PSED|nr:hypothetical protein [Pseudomonas typographi]MBD1590174.1 hypothetical protein [Pseudomonas typographi]MBD1602256.1 hypothetical protein [Pseudomonas typographi]